MLELGGSDAFIVLADADLEQAAQTAATARFQNSGQSCIAAKRFIVEAEVASEFTERLVRAVRGLCIGDPSREDVYIGPLARAGAVFINGMTASDPRLPFGGIKKSGQGRELSAFGAREFVNVKTVWIGPDRGKGKPANVE